MEFVDVLWGKNNYVYLKQLECILFEKIRVVSSKGAWGGANNIL